MSEIILDEAVRHANKINLNTSTITMLVHGIFSTIQAAPNKKIVLNLTNLVIDAGDAHVLASAKETHAQWLVTLDKKHLLILQKKIRWIKIVSPKELLEQITKK